MADVTNLSRSKVAIPLKGYGPNALGNFAAIGPGETRRNIEIDPESPVVKGMLIAQAIRIEGTGAPKAAPKPGPKA